MATSLYVLSCAALLLLLVSPPAEAGAVSVTIISQGGYPWLVKGAYADYLGGTADYVLPNGTLLLNLFSSGQLVPTRTAYTSLDWIMLNRTGDMAWLRVQYHTSGCDASQEQAENYDNSSYTGSKCTKFDFATTLTMEVNVTSREAYIRGQPVGILSFWAPPLIINQTATVGSAFVNGIRHDLLSESSPIYSTSNVLGGPTAVNESGTTYHGPFLFYSLGQATFGTGRNQTFGWLKVYGPQGISFLPKAMPSGTYDYYSGLAFSFSQPEYPIPQIVCGVESDQTVNCNYTTYGTTLGSYFRGSQGELYLNSTNIPINPKSNGNPTGSTFPVSLLDATLAGVALVMVVSLGVVYWRRKRQSGP